MQNILLILFCSVLLLGAAYSSIETPKAWPQIIQAVPAAPYTCTVDFIGNMIYVDDTDDGAEAYLCFCGEDADDATYVWLKVEATATDCF